MKKLIPVFLGLITILCGVALNAGGVGNDATIRYCQENTQTDGEMSRCLVDMSGLYLRAHTLVKQWGQFNDEMTTARCVKFSHTVRNNKKLWLLDFYWMAEGGDCKETGLQVKIWDSSEEILAIVSF